MERHTWTSMCNGAEVGKKPHTPKQTCKSAREVSENSELRGRGARGTWRVEQSAAEEHGEPMWKLFVVISRAIVCSHVWESWFAASTAGRSARDVRVPVCH